MSVTPENAPIRPAYVRDKDTGLYYKLAVVGLPGSGSTGGISDHGALTGLSDPDHPIAAVQGLQAALDAKATPANITTAVSNHAATAGHELLSTTTPAPLGTAAVGNGTTTARSNHVHAMPSAADVGAATAAHTHTLDSLSDVATAGAANGQAIVYNGSSWAPGSVAAATPGRNRIVNGDFSVNQRGFTSGNAASSAVFGHDRWISSGFPSPVTYSTVTAALGELPESAKNYARIVTVGQTGVAASASLYTRLENVGTLSGKTATVSFWAKASAALKIGVQLVQNFGGAGSPSADVIIQIPILTIGTTWTRYSVTAVIPSIAGKTISTNNGQLPDYLLVRFFVSQGSQGYPGYTGIGPQDGTFDFWGVQIEEGSIATPYEQKSYGDELRACQRTFIVFTGNSSGFAATPTLARVAIPLPVPMRIPPYSNNLNLRTPGSISGVAMNPAVTAATMVASNHTTCFVDFTTTGLNQGQGIIAWGQAVDFNAEIF